MTISSGWESLGPCLASNLSGIEDEANSSDKDDDHESEAEDVEEDEEDEEREELRIGEAYDDETDDYMADESDDEEYEDIRLNAVPMLCRRNNPVARARP